MKTSFLIPSLVLAAAGSIHLCASPALASPPSPPPAALPHEHHEFDATLNAPYRGDGRGQPEARSFLLSFDYPGLARQRIVEWQLEMDAPDGHPVRQWQGRLALDGQAVDAAVRWDGLLAGRTPAPGIYHVRLQARVLPDAGDAAADTPAREPEQAAQSWDVAVGHVALPALPMFGGLATGHARGVARLQAAPAPGALPYTVYYGNLHSQSNHSDGGGPLDTCHAAQDPQSAPFSPADAFAYARAHGLDMLMVSEHNHMYDGSDGTNPAADPAVARGLFQSGLQMARDFNAAHPDFLALYGMEWGVIGNGGHLNIFNSEELLGWETNARGELLADTLTARSNYAALYILMAKQGWIGQFNHPALAGQFVVNGKALAYTADGDAAMALCEVVNSTAFSSNSNESETRRSNFEQACNTLLEAGYHLAFSSDQDNHCANWGMSYTNRTAVLIPNGVPLTRDSFLEAVRARRMFATMDRDAQLVLTANGHLMGERFDNAGPLELKVLYAGAPGRSAASVAIMEGVPGRGGAVTQLSAQAESSVAPTPGAHFYYAKVTQDDGRVLWSAPVWVAQLVPTTTP